MSSNFYRIIGMMSGTSMDGIDVSLVSTNGQKLIREKNFFYEYPTSIKNNYLQLDNFKIEKILQDKSNLDFLTSQEHFEALKKSEFLKDAEIISFHGQTILHEPHNKRTIQLGDPYLLSKWTGLETIFNFREKDIQLGGEGAPLAPIYHKTIMEELNLKLPACIINVGGISNLTYWDGKKLIGFDTGPGNNLMDQYINVKKQLYFDNDGKIASKGEVKKEFVEKFLKNNFFEINPPKSLDKNYFNNDLQTMLQSKINIYDGMATLLTCTVESMKKSLSYLPNKPKSLLIVGGGFQNKFLMKQIEMKIDIELYKQNKNISFDFIEAELMAFLGARTKNNLPITFPTTTGVNRPTIGGIIYKY